MAIVVEVLLERVARDAIDVRHVHRDHRHVGGRMHVGKAEAHRTDDGDLPRRVGNADQTSVVERAESHAVREDAAGDDVRFASGLHRITQRVLELLPRAGVQIVLLRQRVRQEERVRVLAVGRRLIGRRLHVAAIPQAARDVVGRSVGWVAKARERGVSREAVATVERAKVRGVEIPAHPVRAATRRVVRHRVLLARDDDVVCWIPVGRNSKFGVVAGARSRREKERFRRDRRLPRAQIGRGGDDLCRSKARRRDHTLLIDGNDVRV